MSEINTDRDIVAEAIPEKESSAMAQEGASVKDQEKTVRKKKKRVNMIACLGWCPLLFFVPLLARDKEDKVARTCAVQGFWALILILAVQVFMVAAAAFGITPFSNVETYGFVIVAIHFVILFFVFVGMVRGYNNRAFKFPVIGNIDLFTMLAGKLDDDDDDDE